MIYQTMNVLDEKKKKIAPWLLLGGCYCHANVLSC